MKQRKKRRSSKRDWSVGSANAKDLQSVQAAARVLFNASIGSISWPEIRLVSAIYVWKGGKWQPTSQPVKVVLEPRNRKRTHYLTLRWGMTNAAMRGIRTMQALEDEP